MSIRLFMAGTPTSNRTVYDNDTGSSTNLLGAFPGATLCVGTTKESSSYAGACMRVRRLSDNVEQDIGWSGKNADVAAFNTFIGVSTARLTKWYDQSGSARDLVQATTSRQPAVIVESGRLVVNFDSTGRVLSPADSTAFKTAQTHLFAVVRSAGMYTTVSMPVAYVQGAVYRWGMFFQPGDDNTPIYALRNTANNGMAIGQGMWGVDDVPVVLDFDTNTCGVHVSGNTITAAGTPASPVDITYSGTGTLLVGNNHLFNAGFVGRMHMFVLYGTTRADRDDITNFIMSPACLSLTDPLNYIYDGFTWHSDITAGYVRRPADSQGLKWWMETPGRAWSFARAAVTGELVRFVVKENDNDQQSGQERDERGCVFDDDSSFAIGDTMDFFAQFKLAGNWAGQLFANGVSWCTPFQHHYGDGSGGPDAFYTNMRNGVFQIWTNGNRANSGAQGSSVAHTIGVWYAVRVLLTWGVDGADDRLECWFGANGSTLTKIVDATGNRFSDVETSFYAKQGIYRGERPTGGGTIEQMVANQRYIKNGVGGNYSAFVTTQPALPVAS